MKFKYTYIYYIYCSFIFHIGEFWLGNEALYRLTKKNDTGLRAEFVDISGEPWFAEYSDFGISSKKLGYSLHVAGYGGNASDALAYQNRMQFSTVDSDRSILTAHPSSTSKSP